SGSGQVFHFLYSDPDGVPDLNIAYVVINNTLAASNGCVFVYVLGGNGLALLNDSGNAWLGPAQPGSPGTLKNSQCTLNLQDSSVSTSGTNLTLNLSLSFSHSFSGAQTVFMYAADNSEQNSGWQARGNWTVP